MRTGKLVWTFHTIPRPGEPEAPATWDLAALTRTCTTAASERHLDARGRALVNRLLVEADRQGFPLTLLSEPAEGTGKMDWRQRYARALGEVLGRVEHEWTQPTSPFKGLIHFPYTRARATLE